MKVFIGWFGFRAKLFASALYAWLPSLFDDVAPWMSETDIPAGERWREHLDRALLECDFAIFVLAREGLGSPWIIHEAAALSRGTAPRPICPILLDLEPAEVPDVLSEFQHKRPDETGIFALVSAIHTRNGQTLAADDLARRFHERWPSLRAAIEAISTVASGPAQAASSAWAEPERYGRSPRLDEVRALAKSRAAESSLRTVARELGMSPATVHGFVSRHFKPQPRTERKLRRWYAETLARGAGAL